VILALFLAAVAPQPGELRTFADWTVGCDNGRACQAVALLPEDGSDGATLTIARGPEANAMPVIWVTVRVEGAQSPATLVIDGRSFPLALDRQSETLRVRDGLAAARLLGQATSILAVGPGGDGRIPVSARGSAAALLYMDEQQRRLGTTSALVRRGPEARVPPPPALPVVTIPAVPKRAPRTVPDARVRQLLGRDATECEYAQKMFVEEARLDARHSLVLASHPCGNGAYNLSYSAFIIDERGRAAPARFDDARPGVDGFDTLVNAGWDEGARRLGTFAKGRGLDDCGVGQDYAWDGRMFRLVEQNQMGECRGSTDYITTWRAEVRPAR
jgi:hypothetical protein